MRLSRKHLALSAALFASCALVALSRPGERAAAADLPEAFTYRLDLPAAAGPDPPRYREEDPIPLGTTALRGLAVGAGGETAVIAGGELVALDPVGGVAWRVPLTGEGTCIAAGDDGNYYLGLKDRIVVLDRTGARLASWQSLGERAWVTSLAVRDGLLFAADAGNRVVWRFDTSGRLLGSFGRKDLAAGAPGFAVPSPYFDVALGPAGELWVVNPGLLRVERYRLDGSLLGFWGEASLAPQGFIGCCNPTHLALLPDGSFVASDKGLPRVRVFDREGRLGAIVAAPEAFNPRAVGLDLAVRADGRILVLDPQRAAIRVFAPPAARQGEARER
jgi:outer membrane protein assembly factor BamB